MKGNQLSGKEECCKISDGKGGKQDEFKGLFYEDHYSRKGS